MRQTTVDPLPWGGEVVEKWQERNERGGCGEGRKRGVGARTERERRSWRRELVERRNATACGRKETNLD
jgi:hypothetical protein